VYHSGRVSSKMLKTLIEETNAGDAMW